MTDEDIQNCIDATDQIMNISEAAVFQATSEQKQKCL